MLSKPVVVAAASAAEVVVAASRWFRAHMLRRYNIATTLWRFAALRYRLRSGCSQLALIADFDRTLTTARCGTSCHGVLESCAELSAEYRAATTRLVETYLPIETSTTISREEKIPLMQDWYRQAHELLIKESLTRQILDTAAANSAAELRPGCDALFELCADRGIPLIVCSAGLGNVVQALLCHRLAPNVETKVLPMSRLPIVSNWLTFDTAGLLSGFSQPLLHMFNKNAAFIRQQLGDERWRSLMKTSTGAGTRRLLLLLGDGLGDATMADGIGDEFTVLKIGLLNERAPDKVAAMLPLYEAAFDVVLLGDGPLDWVLELLCSLKS